MELRVTFDRSADCAFIYLREIEAGGVATACNVECDEAMGDVVVNLDREGRIIGIEIIGATRGLPAAVLESAERI
jgi:uncharacterized protein YuzE